MSIKRFTAYFVIVGAILPLIWFVFYWVAAKHNQDLMRWISLSTGVERVLLMLWPSSILMIGDPEDRNWMLAVVSIALNAALYGILGWLFWIGLHRSKFVLAATIVSIFVGWGSLLSL